MGTGIRSSSRATFTNDIFEKSNGAE